MMLLITTGNTNNEAPNSKQYGFYQSVRALQRRAENGFDLIGFRLYFVELNGGIHSILGKRVVLDADASQSVIKLNNGYLTTVRDTQSPLIEEHAENVIALYENLTERGIDFLYINAPFKIDKYDTQLPNGLSDYTNSDADKFLNILIQSNVPTVDLREELRQAGLNHYDLFFRTDHHWTPEAGLWAAGLVMNKYLPQYRYGNADLYDISNYYVDTHEQIFLGSWGRRTGRLYAGLDDISVITPNFETELYVSIPHRGYAKSGSFLETVIDPDDITYNRYIGGNADARIVNATGNGKTCVVIGDSFSRVVLPFIALEFSEVYRYDTRQIPGDMTAYEYIELHNPDVVIVIYNPTAQTDYEMMQFGG